VTIATATTGPTLPTRTVESEVAVETPENVWLTFRPAGPAPRMWAYFIDLCIRIGILIVLAIGVAILAPTGLSGIGPGFLMIAFFVLDWGYGFLFEWLWRGRTPGKRAAGLRVLRVTGSPVGPMDALLRNLLRAADSLPVGYGVGLVTMIATRRMQRLGDLVAGTFVVHEDREVVRGYPPWIHGVPAIPAPSFAHAFRPPERTLDRIETFLGRAQTLPPAQADAIAWILAEPLIHRLGYAEPGVDVRAAPGWFLLRVLRTFAYPPAAEGAPAPAVPVAAPAPTPWLPRPLS
jgi:uncharacterized RDD family membrane protein YckC